MSVKVCIKNLQKNYKDAFVIGGLDLEIQAGEIVALFGPNGSGKSTLLNIIAGIDKEHGGHVQKEAQAKLNSVVQAYMFQNYRDTLFHWRTGWQNIMFPKEIQKENSFSNVKKFIDMIAPGISARINLHEYPYMYSGGQQQILAFLRSLILKPNLLLIDEPFSALDYENNLSMRSVILNYHRKFKPTVIFVTHNIEEAVHLADKIVILSKKPTKVAEIVENDHGQDKNLDFMASPYFNSTKDKILKKFRSVAGL